MTDRVVVIGAGPGGLASAMLLARAGLDVTIVERLERVGGRSGRFHANGFTFDIGATFFLYPRIVEEIFEACGRRFADEVSLARLDPLYRLVFEEGGELLARSNPEAMEAEIVRLSPGDAGGYRRFLEENRRKFAAFKPILQSAFSGPSDLLRLPVLDALRVLRPHRSVDSDLSRYFRDPRLRLAFSFQSKYLGMSPFQCPSLFTILAFMEHEHGVFHPRGGCGGVMEQMAAAARELGVEIRLGEPVEEISFQGRRAVGVRTPAAAYPADAVVVNADFADTMKRLVPDRLRRRWHDRNITRKRFSCSTFMMYLGIAGRIDELGHHTILLAKDYRRNITEIESGATPPEEPSIYVQNACSTDPSLAPPGQSTLYVLAPVAHDNGTIDWAREQGRFRNKVFERLHKLGLGDLERRIRYERVTTPTMWRDDMRIHLGATFNLAHSLDQMLHRRPHNRFEDIDGMYLVGGGTHPGSGLPVIFESARITSRLLLQELGERCSRPRNAEIPSRIEPAGLGTHPWENPA